MPLLHMPLAGMATIHDALHEAGAGRGLHDIGSHALRSLRMEKAHPGGNEPTPEAGLVEAGMLRFFGPDNRHQFRAVGASGSAAPWRSVGWMRGSAPR